MNILVTGGCGFIGSNTVEKLLELGHQITIIDTSAGAPKSAKVIDADIRSLEDLKSKADGNFDAVIHLAAKSDARNMQDFRLFKEINIDGTMNVLEFARQKDIGKVIFPSSSHVYGDIKDDTFKESGPINPVSYYGVTKFLGETICKAYSDFYGIDCTALRLFTVYGPRGRTDMAVMKFVQSIGSGEPIEVHGNGKIKKDFVYIDDVSDSIITCLDTKLKFEVINIGSGRPTELSKIVELIESGLRKKAEKVYVPMQAGDVVYSCADISKAERLLGWKPAVPIDAGIKKTIEWWSSQPK